MSTIPQSRDLLKTLKITKQGGTDILYASNQIDNLIMKTRISPKNCFYLDLASFDNIIQISMTFQKCDNCGVAAVVEDKNMMCDRELGFLSFYNFGDTIEKPWLGVLEDMSLGWRTFIVKFDQEVFVEEDESKHCVIYPNKMHNSYNDCDKMFVKNTLQNYFGEEFTPFWATGNMSKVSTGNISDPFKTYNYVEVFDGSSQSDCPLPCKTTFMTTKLLDEKYHKDPAVHIIFADSVTLTKTDFVSFNFWTFLSDTGGALGLWLGLGVIQASEIVLGYAADIIPWVLGNTKAST